MREMRREVREVTSIGEWLDWRRTCLTASRIGVLFEAHPYMSRDQLVAEMQGRSIGSNSAMRRGRILEPAVAAAVAEERPEWRLRKASTFHLLPSHRLGCTPDYFAETEAGLLNVQCKTVNPDTWEKWAGRPNLGYLLQVATENLVTDAAAGVLAVMIYPGLQLHLFDVPRHSAAEQKILDAVAEWWAKWDAGEIAAPVPAEAIAADLDDGSHRDLSGDNLLPTLLPERARLKAEESRITARLKELDYEIKNRVGPARTAWLPGWTISYAAQERKEFTVPAKTVRVLRVKETVEIENE